MQFQNHQIQYFTSLSNISSILGLGSPQVPDNSFTTLPIEQFVGRMDISGNVTLKSNSLQLDSTDRMMSVIMAVSKIPVLLHKIRIYEDNKLNRYF